MNGRIASNRLDRSRAAYRGFDDGPAHAERDWSKPIYRVLSNGEQDWRLNGSYHREDGPARILSDGTEMWYQDGQLHRLDGPAVHTAHGEVAWYYKGLRHRDDDGPAYENLVTGEQRWFWYGLPHRDDGPAFIQPETGTQAWMQKGKLHRVGAPAIISEQFPDDIGYAWFQDGVPHRDPADGPAIIETSFTPDPNIRVKEILPDGCYLRKEYWDHGQLVEYWTADAPLGTTHPKTDIPTARKWRAAEVPFWFDHPEEALAYTDIRQQKWEQAKKEESKRLNRWGGIVIPSQGHASVKP